jgi:mRNA interferase MazF
MLGKCVRGMVVDVDWEPVVGHEQGKRRPCVVIQNDVGNTYSSITIVAAITGAEHVKKLSRVQVLLPKGTAGLEKESVVLCDQIRSVDQRRLRTVRGKIPEDLMRQVDGAVKVSLALQ